MNINYAKLAEFCEAYKVNYNVLCMYVREAVALQPPSGGEVRAWMRRWAFDGVDVMALPKKERPRGWQLRDVTEAKCLDDDVPLYTAPPSAPVGVEDFSCCGGNDETPKLHCLDCPDQQPAAVDVKSVLKLAREFEDEVRSKYGFGPAGNAMLYCARRLTHLAAQPGGSQ